MIAKIITSGATRSDALASMHSALSELEVRGLTTNLNFLLWLVSHQEFEAGNLSTTFIDRYYEPGAREDVPLEVVVASGIFFAFARWSLAYVGRSEKTWSAAPWRQAGLYTPVRVLVQGQEFSLSFSTHRANREEIFVSVQQGEDAVYNGSAWASLGPEPAADGRFAGVPASVQLRLGEDGAVISLPYRRPRDRRFFVTWNNREYSVREADPLSTDTLERAVHLANEDTLESPMPGKVLKVFVAPGDAVKEEQPLVIIEAMKMEFTVRAPHAGHVATVRFSEGAQVAVGDVLVELEK